MISVISLYLPTNFEFFDKLLIKRFAANGMLLESIDLNLNKLFFRYANFVQCRYKSCKCFKDFEVFLFDFYLRIFRYVNFVKCRYKSCKCFKDFEVFLFDFYLCSLLFSN